MVVLGIVDHFSDFKKINKYLIGKLLKLKYLYVEYLYYLLKLR